MPSLIRELAVSGSRKSDGTANDSGKVFLYEPGTTTIVPGYRSDSLDEAWPTDGGGIPLDAGGRVKIWVNDPVDVVIEDSDGATLDTMLGYNRVRAEQVQVENDSYTGDITDASGAVSEGLGGITDLHTILTTLASSLGQNGQFLEGSGATARDYDDVIREIRVSVKDYGAVGNGIADDTTAIQAAISRVKAAGGGIVYFPPGTYKTSSALSLTSATGVTIRGAGPGVSVIASSSTTANGLVLTSCTSCALDNFSVAPTSTSSGANILITTGNTILVSNVAASNATFGIDVTGSFISIRDCVLNGAGGTGRAIRSAAAGATIIGGQVIAGTGAAIEFTGAAARTSVIGVDFGAVAPTSPTGILFNAALTGSRFDILGCPTLGSQTTPIDVTGVAVWPAIRQWGNGVQGGSSTSGAVGAAQTPVLMIPNEVRLRASSGGAGTVTVNAPAVTPSGTDTNELYWDFIFSNFSGGAVTWDITTAGVYKFASAVPTTDNHIISIRVRYDASTAKYREVSRADTVV